MLWVQHKIKNEISKASKDIDAYNNYITEKLTLRKRFGRIKRIQLWENVPGIERLDKELGQANLRRFEAAVNKIDKEVLIGAMTADEFFQYCQLCYDANDYFKDKNY